MALGGSQQISHVDRKGASDLMKHRQCGVGLARFDPAHVCPEEAASIGQLFLREPMFDTQFLDPQAQALTRIEFDLFILGNSGRALRGHVQDSLLGILFHTHTDSYIRHTTGKTMQLKQWQQRVVRDELVEVGPSRQEANATQFSYLEFRNEGRVRNVTVFDDMLSKLSETQNVGDALFYLLEGQNVRTADASTALIAVGREGGPTFGIDLKSRGSDSTMADTDRARRTGKLLQWAGAALVLLGIPLVLVFIGILMIGGGIVLWRTGKKIATGMEYQMEMLEQCSAMLARIPGVRLI